MRKIIVALSIGVLVLAGCSPQPTSGAQTSGQQDTEQAFKQQSAAVPYPKAQLGDSLERRNLSRNLLNNNTPNKIQYVYLLSMTGGYIGYYVIKGKVSSTQSQMTADQLIVWTCPGYPSVTSCDSSRMQPSVVNAPGDDGSYGANEPGIFFFTTEGTEVRTSLEYVESDQPLPVNAPKLNTK